MNCDLLCKIRKQVLAKILTKSIVENRNSNIYVSERFLKLLFNSSAFMNKTDLKSDLPVSCCNLTKALIIIYNRNVAICNSHLAKDNKHLANST